MKAFAAFHSHGSLDLQKQSDSSKDPLGGFFFCLQVKGPDIGGTSHPCLIDRTFVDVLGVHAVHGDGSDEDDWHHGGQLLQPSICDRSRRDIPPSTCTVTELAWYQQPDAFSLQNGCFLTTNGWVGVVPAARLERVKSEGWVAMV